MGPKLADYINRIPWMTIDAARNKKDDKEKYYDTIQ